MCLSVNCVLKTLVAFIMIVVPNAPLAAQNTIGTDITVPPVSMTVTRVPVLVGEDAEMPCDIRPPMLNDSLLFVVWYRDDNAVYSYDTRMPASSAYWASGSYLGRATWHSTPTSGLKLLDVRAKDRAVYTCRVDFHESPTRNYKVTLDVIGRYEAPFPLKMRGLAGTRFVQWARLISSASPGAAEMKRSHWSKRDPASPRIFNGNAASELPKKPIIFDEYGKEIKGTAGPYPEGGSLKLICNVQGGYPTPRIQWLKGGMLIKSLSASDQQEGHETRSLTLVVLNLTRQDLDSMYTCSADNTILAMRLETTVIIDLYLKPLTVDIVSLEQTLRTNRKSEFLCKTTGSRPPAAISWWLGGNKLNNTAIAAGSEFGTESLLPWMPLREHSGQVLTCRAEHTKYNFTSIQSNITLNVYYVPEANIVLPDKVNLNYIEEGDDVHFACKVDANPPAYKVIWEQNGTQIHHEPSVGILGTANMNLTLHNVSRHHAGQYTCTASNTEGDGGSPLLNMHVVYKPLCKRRDVQIIGAALQEGTAVECEVDAFPPPNSFEWTLNNAASNIKVDSDRFIIEEKEGRSVLTYIPVSDIDYGTLECRATNAAGQQLSPCVYTLKPQSNPYPPTNCTVYNLTYDSLDLLCEPGYEGGLQCIYVVEVWAREGLVVNASNEVPLWNLRRLGSDRQLRLIIYAANARGRSEHVTITASTAPGKIVKKYEFMESLEARDWQLSWAVGISCGTIITVAIILCLAFIATRIRDRSRDYEVNIPIVKNQSIIVPTRTLQAEEKASKLDFVPSNKGLNMPPDPPRYSDIAGTQGYAHSTLRINQPNISATHLHNTDLQNDAVRFVVNAMARPHREIVTTRMSLRPHQESYV